MFINHLNEEPLEFRLPDWENGGIIAAFMVTLFAATYIFFGMLLAIACLITFVVSMILWLKTTFKTRKMRRIIPHVVLVLVFLLIQNVEFWWFDFPNRWHQTPLASGDPAFEMKIFMGFYFFGILGFGLLSILLTFYHNHFGNFITWYLFVHGIVLSLVCISGFFAAGSVTYFPGVGGGILLSLTCISGIRFILKNYRG